MKNDRSSIVMSKSVFAAEMNQMQLYMLLWISSK